MSPLDRSRTISLKGFLVWLLFIGWGMTYKDTLHFSFYFESEMSLYLKFTKSIATYSQHSDPLSLFINLMKLFTLIPYQQQANMGLTCQNRTLVGSVNSRI